MTTDNPQIPVVFNDSYVPDQLIAGPFQRVTANGTITGGANLARGTVLGQVTLGTATATAGTNTGTGTFTMDGTAPIQPLAKVGNYLVTILATGRAQLKDPNGVDLGEYDFSAGGSVTITDQIKGVLADNSSTHFVAGDSFTIAVTAGSGSYKESVATALDGSQNPVAILVDQANAASADVLGGLFLTGEFNANAIIYDASWSVAALTPILAGRSIFLKSPVSAALPSE